MVDIHRQQIEYYLINRSSISSSRVNEVVVGSTEADISVEGAEAVISFKKSSKSISKRLIITTKVSVIYESSLNNISGIDALQ